VVPMSTARKEDPDGMVEHCYRTRKTMVNPIVDWTDEDVWEFLTHYGCKSNPLYECGFKRIGCKDSILEDCRLMQTTLTDCTGIDAEIESLLEEIDVVTELTKRCIADNSQTAQNQEEYAARYNGFVDQYEKAKAQLEQLRTTKAAREAQAEAIGAFMFEVQELDALTEFDEKLWLTIIDTVTVHTDGRMTFRFQGGTEIDV